VTEPTDLLIYGAGGFGREVAAWAEESSWLGHRVRLRGFIDDGAPVTAIDERPVLSIEQATAYWPDARFAIAVGTSSIRERLAAVAEAAGLRASPPLVHPSVITAGRSTIGDGSIVCPGTTLTTEVEIGRHVIVNLHCTVTHDTRLDDFVTLSPGTAISGNVTVRRGAFMGTGAITINGAPGHPLIIGEGATVGAGSVVMKDVPAGATVFGAPARPMLSQHASST
jgi:sugar O-acyltransferase (sialic acid O-acetyltransferase NeuD family)